MTVDDLKKKYLEKIEKEFGEVQKSQSNKNPRAESAHYLEFKKELLPHHLNIYERLCNWSEKLLKISPSKKNAQAYRDAIEICHLDITSEGAASFSIIIPLIIVLAGAFFGYIIPLLFGEKTIFFVVFFLILGLILMLIFSKLPQEFAKRWRLKASSEMVLSIFYVVTYMRHTSNLENALDFAAEHLSGPLALDFKKILWDVETQKFESVKESISFYLESWKAYNSEFVEAMHLVESSLLEPTETRRLQSLDKSLDVILQETYEKMLHYAHNLKSPLTMLHMLGIILPILGLVILPLMVSIMENVKWYYIATLYNIILPVAVYMLGKEMLTNRPTGYGDVDLSEGSPELRKLKKIKFMGFYISPLFICLAIFFIFLIIGLSPVYLHSKEIPKGGISPGDICFNRNWVKYNPALIINEKQQPLFCVFEYRQSPSTGEIVGPFGLVATLLSIFVVLAFGISIGLYYTIKSRKVIELRNSAKKLETEFSSGLFQLGNRMADGLPPEIAMGRVAETMEGTMTGNFFARVSNNITRLGMSVNQAIFNTKTGVIFDFPSAMIASSMKVLVESSKKGPRIAANTMMNISEYIKEIHRVNERLKDLMGDIISSMKSQINFLTPAISAIVVGITSMLTYILGRLNLLQASGGLGEAGGIAQLFAGDGIPPFFFQIIVGIYVVQLVYILTVLGNSIENGEDKLEEEYMLGKNMLRSAVLYSTVTAITILLFSLLAGVILSKGLGG